MSPGTSQFSQDTKLGSFISRLKIDVGVRFFSAKNNNSARPSTLPYLTSSIMASPPVISTVSPGPCVRTARASGDT
jgi:hypothetical protein